MNISNYYKKACCLLLSVTYYLANSQSLIINELMVNPNGGSLPNVEYVEIYNAATITVNLKDYTYRVGNTSINLPDYFVAPKQYIILVSDANKQQFEHFGNVVGLSRWLTLNNTGASISIHTINRELIDSVNYTNKWYKEANKNNGGWSLERINPLLSCQLDVNWSASIDYQGGTPGKQNSIYQTDYKPEIKIKEIRVANNLLYIGFNQNVESYLQISKDQIQLSPINEIPQHIEFITPDTLLVRFAADLIKDNPYEINIINATYCNQLINFKEIVFVAEKVGYNDIIINELLFNPRKDGADFVEIYNNSNRIINLKKWYLGNRLISDKHHLLYPQEYRVLTNDVKNIKLNYPSAVEENMIQLPNIPRYANEQGIVTIAYDNTTIDSLYYTSGMHHPFIDNPKGISLERQDALLPTNATNTFLSAATLSEGATPGYKNSKNSEEIIAGNNFILRSKTVSPDGDLHEDLLLIDYQLDNSNYMINLHIINDAGTIINRLIRNKSIGISGVLQWDGLLENKQNAKDGIYLYHIELYNHEGYYSTYKNSFVLIRRGISY